MIDAVTVVHVSMETSLVGVIFHGPDVTAWLLYRVFANHSFACKKKYVHILKYLKNRLKNIQKILFEYSVTHFSVIIEQLSTPQKFVKRKDLNFTL